MKKLKLQKALLAICLALPITLTKNQAISATETNIEISANKDDDKETNANQTLQQQLDTIANIKTHTEALKYYIDITKPKKLGKEEYKDFLHYYIKDDTEKYLALIIQANKNLIQFPNNINLDTTLTSETIYRMLINNLTDIINPINLNDEPHSKNLFKDIPQYFSKLEQAQKDKLPAYEKILKEIFTPAVTETNSYLKRSIIAITSFIWRSNDDSTNNLTDLIGTYIKQQEKGQKQPNPEYPSSNILILLDDVAKQLHKEAAAFDDKHAEQKQKLEEIANQIERFDHVYFADNNNNKQTEKEEEKKESELNISNLSSKSQKTDDIIIEDIKEENKKEIIDTSKKDEIEVTEQEGEEEKIDKQNNSILNTRLSVISEEKKVENDEENKEEVESPKNKSKEPEIKAVQDETQKEVKDTQTENKKSDDTDIEEIKQLINEWQQKKEEINKDKEEKLTQLEKDIKELEQKYDKIVNGDEEDDDNMC